MKASLQLSGNFFLIHSFIVAEGKIQYEKTLYVASMREGVSDVQADAILPD